MPVPLLCLLTNNVRFDSCFFVTNIRTFFKIVVSHTFTINHYSAFASCLNWEEWDLWEEWDVKFTLLLIPRPKNPIPPKNPSSDIIPIK